MILVKADGFLRRLETVIKSGPEMSKDGKEESDPR